MDHGKPELAATRWEGGAQQRSRHSKSRAPDTGCGSVSGACYSLNTTCMAVSGLDGDCSRKRPLTSEKRAKTAARTKTLVSPWVKTISARFSGAAPSSRPTGTARVAVPKAVTRMLEAQRTTHLLHRLQHP